MHRFLVTDLPCTSGLKWLELSRPMQVGGVDEEFWERAITLMDFGNGDQVLLDPGSGADPENPPVVYFNHECSDKMVSMIAPSFTVFLQRLEEQAYTDDYSDWLIYDPKRIAYIKELTASSSSMARDKTRDGNSPAAGESTQQLFDRTSLIDPISAGTFRGRGRRSVWSGFRGR